MPIVIVRAIPVQARAYIRLPARSEPDIYITRLSNWAAQRTTIECTTLCRAKFSFVQAINAHLPLKKARIEILLLFLLYVFIMPHAGMQYDMQAWADWALYIHQHGLGNVYNNASVNYMPLYLYGLYVYDLLQGTAANIVQHIYSIKILFLCFDFLPLAVLYAMRRKILSFNIPYLYLLLNIAYVFNSLVWGQADSMYTNLAFLAVIASFFYPVAGVLLFLLALNTKLQAVVLLPVVGIALIYGIRKAKTAILAVCAATTLQALILLPFIKAGTVGNLCGIATHAVGYYNKLSISAFNIWYLAAPGNPYFITTKTDL